MVRPRLRVDRDHRPQGRPRRPRGDGQLLQELQPLALLEVVIEADPLVELNKVVRGRLQGARRRIGQLPVERGSNHVDLELTLTLTSRGLLVVDDHGRRLHLGPLHHRRLARGGERLHLDLGDLGEVTLRTRQRGRAVTSTGGGRGQIGGRATDSGSPWAPVLRHVPPARRKKYKHKMQRALFCPYRSWLLLRRCLGVFC